jgi:hypothetical protein
MEYQPDGTTKDRVPLFVKDAADEFTVWVRLDDVLVT